MSGNVPPPPPPGPAPQDWDGDPSRSPARPTGSYQAPPSFAPGASGATARSSTSAGSPSAPSAAERTMPHPVYQTTPQPAATAQPTAAQPASSSSPSGYQHAPIPPAPAAQEQAVAAQTQVQGRPVPQVPHRQPSYSAPAPQYGYMSQPPAYQQQPAYQPPPAYQQPAQQAPAQHQGVQPGPSTTQNPVVGHTRRRLSPGWIAFIVVDVVLIVVAGIFAFNALTGSAPQVPQDDETVAAAPSEGATDDAEAAAAADPGEQLAEFASPSRNISCEIFENAVTCGIAALEQQPAPVESCDGTTGYVVTLDAEGMVSLPCVQSGDTPKKAPKKMDQVDYGESVTQGDFTCESRQDGMYCQHDPTGNGFSLARAGIGTSE